ncbi:hypothetical protein PanWU01x14_026560, partial [Parasponia andersonii]
CSWPSRRTATRTFSARTGRLVGLLVTGGPDGNALWEGDSRIWISPLESVGLHHARRTDIREIFRAAMADVVSRSGSTDTSEVQATKPVDEGLVGGGEEEASEGRRRRDELE